MSTNVGNLSVSMGVDLAEFQSGMQRATEMARSQTSLMSAEMKRQSREGAESLRLIDESIGIHISRPLTRIIGQSQLLGPALAGIFQLSGAVALGSVIAESVIPKVIELTNYMAGWGEADQKAYKEAISLNQEFVKELERHKQAMLDISHIGLGGSELIRQLIKENTAELEKQQTILEDLRKRLIVLQAPMLIGEVDPKAQQSRMDTIAQRMQGMSGLMKQLQDQAVELQAKLGKVSAVEGIEQAKKAIRDAQDEMRGWNEENNKAVQSWMQLNEQLELGLAKSREFQRSRPTIAELGPLVNPIPAPLPPVGAPMLKDQAELKAVTDDQNEAWRKAGEVLEELETPEQKYAAGLAMIAALQNRLTTDQVTLATQKLNEELALATNHMARLQEAQRKALESTNGIKGGFQAFFLQLKIDSEQKGRFVFDELRSAMQGFENNMAQQLVTGRANWKSFFQSLEEDLLKFAMDQTLQTVLKQLAGLAGGGGGFFSGLASLFGGGKAGGGDVTPGMTYIVGENGPEVLTMGANASGYITPNGTSGANRRGGDLYIDARGADAGVEQRIMRVVRMSEDRAVARAVTTSREMQKRTASF